MGVGLTNKDYSFFAIESDDVNLEKHILTEDIESLTVDEELGKMDSGSISFNDPTHLYSRILRTGVTLNLVWGYAKRSADPSIPKNLFNSDIFSDQIERRGLKVFVTSPGGNANDKGKVTYNCNFLALDMRGSDNFIRYKSGTKGDVISDIFDRLGVQNREINFQRMREKITPDTEVMQWESDFKTLVRLSFEWRATFRLGYTANGELVGFFLDTWLISDSVLNKSLTGIRTNVFYDYGGSSPDPSRPITVANVISYEWKDQSGESGTGDNVQMRWVNGKPMFIRYQAETQSVLVYELNEEEMQRELNRRGDFASKTALISEWLSVKDFEQIKRYFTPVKQETAPQGTGIISNIKTLGSPIYTVGLAAEIGAGFPDRVRAKGVKIYVRKISHMLSMSGYFCDHELADAYVFSPTGTVLSLTGYS